MGRKPGVPDIGPNRVVRAYKIENKILADTWARVCRALGNLPPTRAEIEKDPDGRSAPGLLRPTQRKGFYLDEDAEERILRME